MNWTKEALARLSQQQRHDLYQNAKRSGRPGADDLMRLIERAGLPYADPTGLKLNSPIGRKISRIVNSREGVAAAMTATAQGRPALAGVDPLLSAKLGDEYARTYEATVQAGYMIAIMMRKKGYIGSGIQGSIEGGVAETGEIYKPIQ